MIYRNVNPKLQCSKGNFLLFANDKEYPCPHCLTTGMALICSYCFEFTCPNCLDLDTDTNTCFYKHQLVTCRDEKCISCKEIAPSLLKCEFCLNFQLCDRCLHSDWITNEKRQAIEVDTVSKRSLATKSTKKSTIKTNFSNQTAHSYVHEDLFAKQISRKIVDATAHELTSCILPLSRELFLTGGRFGIKLWSTKICALVGTLEDKPSWISGLAKVDDDTFVSVYFYNGTIKVWSFADLRQIEEIKTREQCFTAVTGLEEAILAAGNCDISIWDVKNKFKMLTLKGHSKSITSIVKLCDNTIASCADDCTVRIWNYKSGNLLSLMTDDKTVFSAILSNRDGFLLALCKDKAVNWNVTTSEKTEWDIEKVTSGELIDGKVMAVGFENGKVEIWDWLNREKLFGALPKTNFGKSVKAIAMVGKTLVCVSSDGKICMFDLFN